MVSRRKKRGLQEGGAIAIRLKRGGFAVGIWARFDRGQCGLGYFFGPRLKESPTLEDVGRLRADDTVLVTKVHSAKYSDDIWEPIGLVPGWNRDDWPVPEMAINWEPHIADVRTFDQEKFSSHWLRSRRLPSVDVEGMFRDGSGGPAFVQHVLDQGLPLAPDGKLHRLNTINAVSLEEVRVVELPREVAEAPILQRLASVGIEVRKLRECIDLPKPKYRAALPVLLRQLNSDHPDSAVASLAVALARSEARRAAFDPMLSRYIARGGGADELAYAISFSIAQMAGKQDVALLVQLLENRSFGESRSWFLRKLVSMRDPAAMEAVERNEFDPELRETIGALLYDRRRKKPKAHFVN